MDRCCWMLALFGAVFYPPFLCSRIANDLAHPEWWGNPLHNPAVTFVWLGLLGAAALALGCYHLCIVCKERPASARLTRGGTMKSFMLLVLPGFVRWLATTLTSAVLTAAVLAAIGWFVLTTQNPVKAEIKAQAKQAVKTEVSTWLFGSQP